MIPCEVCEQMVRFGDYNDHIRECTQVYMTAAPLLSTFFPILSPGFANLEQRASSRHRELRDEGHQPGQQPGQLGQGQQPGQPGQLGQLGQLGQQPGQPGQGQQQQPGQSERDRIFISFSLNLGQDELIRAILGLESQQEFDQWVSDELGPVRVGVDNVAEVTTMISAKDCPADSACPICQELLSDQEDVRRINKCKHCYCSSCIETWLAISKKCPLCMTRLDE